MRGIIDTWICVTFIRPDVEPGPCVSRDLGKLAITGNGDL